jgi:hypothetical protein
MTLEDVIESLNVHILNKRRDLHILSNSQEHLVLQRVIEPHPTFKSYKRYEFILWVVGNDSKYRLLTLTKQVNMSDIPSYAQESFIKATESEFVTGLFGLILDGKSFNKKDRTILEDIIYGEYLGYGDECVLDPLD